MTSVSVRTLRHYDAIGLLKPLGRTDSKYRYYGPDELLKMQQIMLYRELGLPLSRISEIVNDPGFDTVAALEQHKTELRKRREELGDLLETVEWTIKQLNQKTEMNYEELYEGFPKEQAKSYRKEAAERWGEKTVDDSEQRLIKMGKQNFEALKQQGHRIYLDLVKLLDSDPAGAAVQKLIAEHYEMTGKYFDVKPGIYRNLGIMYVEDERFKATFDRYDTRLAAFLQKAMEIFTAGAEH